MAKLRDFSSWAYREWTLFIDSRRTMLLTSCGKYQKCFSSPLKASSSKSSASSTADVSSFSVAALTGLLAMNAVSCRLFCSLLDLLLNSVTRQKQQLFKKWRRPKNGLHRQMPSVFYDNVIQWNPPFDNPLRDVTVPPNTDVFLQRL